MSEYDVTKLLNPSETTPDLIIDGVHYGRGEFYCDEKTSLKHTTLEVKCWRIVRDKLEPVEKKKNEFYSEHTYIVLWRSKTDSGENEVYFHWKGEDAPKGHSPLPDSIIGNPPVERIVQWAEPPAFLRLFSGSFVVHRGGVSTPRLYLLRGEVDSEAHLFEVDLKKHSLRSRTAFILHFEKSVVWYGKQASARCKSLARQTAERIFGGDVSEEQEGGETSAFLDTLKGGLDDYLRHLESKVIDYTPRLFYFTKITGSFLVVEVESSHKSEFLTPFPVLQSHLYTAEQPAIFLLDDNDEIWIWYGWNRDEDADFKSDSFTVAINYAKRKSKSIQRLVKIHKVIAGFEPLNFTNLFPVWRKREDIAQLQKEDGVLPAINPLAEIISEDGQS